MSLDLKKIANGDPKWRSKRSPVKKDAPSAALSILQREEREAKKSRVKMVLQQQYVQKYGSKQANSALNNIICVTISDFVDSCDSIKEIESSVQTLEQELKEITTTFKQKHSTSRHDVREESRQREAASTSGESHSASNSRPQSQSITVDPKQWTVVNAIVAVTEEQRAKAEHDALVAKKRFFKDSLDKQMEAVTIRKMGENGTDKEFIRSVYADVEKYHEEENSKVAARQNKNHQEMKLRLDQIAANSKRINDEKEMMRQYGLAEIERAKMAIENEKELVERKKREQREAAERVRKENERNLELKELQRQKDKEYEAKLQKDMEDRLIREEKARASYFQDKMDKMQRGNAKFEASTGAILKEQAAAKEELLRSTIEAKNAQDLEKERIKQETRRRNMEEGLRFNETLIQRKQREKQQEIEDSNRRAKELADKVAEMNAAEELKEKIRKEKMIALKQDLDMQVQWKKQKETNDYALSDKEVMLNKSLIQKLADPTLVAKVAEKLSVPPTVTNPKYKKTSLSG